MNDLVWFGLGVGVAFLLLRGGCGCQEGADATSVADDAVEPILQNLAKTPVRLSGQVGLDGRCLA